MGRQLRQLGIHDKNRHRPSRARTMRDSCIVSALALQLGVLGLRREVVEAHERDHDDCTEAVDERHKRGVHLVARAHRVGRPHNTYVQDVSSLYTARRDIAAKVHARRDAYVLAHGCSCLLFLAFHDYHSTRSTRIGEIDPNTHLTKLIAVSVGFFSSPPLSTSTGTYLADPPNPSSS